METVGIILLIAGFILIGVEMVVPGFGAPGISGIASLVSGILLTSQSVEEGLTITVIVVVILAVMLTLAMIFLKKVKTPFVLEDSVKPKEDYLNVSDLEYLVGKEGVASSDLKPVGKCSIEGIEFDVRAESRYVERGTKVHISCIRENTIMVKEI